MSFHDGDRLVAVSLCDVTKHLWSAILLLLRPPPRASLARIGNVMLSVELARQRGIPHVYLGYRVLGCPSDALQGGIPSARASGGRPGPDDEPHWISPPEARP